MRDTLLTLWNTWSFFTTYAALNGFDPADPAVPAPADRSVLDRWMLSRLHATVAEVTAALDGYEPFPAATALAELVDDTSNWYVRRSRRRFWRTDPGADPADSLGAQATLHEVLVTLARLLAPMTPVRGRPDVAGPDRRRRRPTRCTWPTGPWPTPALVDAGARGAAWPWPAGCPRSGRAARAEAGVKVRQPLARALVYLPPGSPMPPPGVVEDELNVDRVEVTDRAGRRPAPTSWCPNFKLLGPRLGKRVQDLRAGHGRRRRRGRGRRLWPRAGRWSSSWPTGPSSSCADEVELRVRAQPGFAVSRDGAEVLALDLALDDDLRRRGLAREVIRHVQDLRKATGLEVSDTIRPARGRASTTSRPLFDAIAREVLAVRIVTVAPRRTPAPGTAVDRRRRDGAHGVTIWVGRA